MNEFINLLIKHWKLLALCVLVLVDFILRVTHKKPVKVVDSVRENIAVILPYFIYCAEEKYGRGNGDKKLEYAADLTIDHIKKMFSLSDDVANGYRPLITLLINTLFDKLKSVMSGK